MYSAFTGIGGSFIVFSLSVIAAFESAGTAIPTILFTMLYAYLFVGAILALLALTGFIRLKSSEKEDIEKIKKTYLDW